MVGSCSSTSIAVLSGLLLYIRTYNKKLILTIKRSVSYIVDWLWVSCCLCLLILWSTLTYPCYVSTLMTNIRFESILRCQVFTNTFFGSVKSFVLNFLWDSWIELVKLRIKCGCGFARGRCMKVFWSYLCNFYGLSLEDGFSKVSYFSANNHFCTALWVIPQTNLFPNILLRESPYIQCSDALRITAIYSNIDSLGFWFLVLNWKCRTMMEGVGSKWFSPCS